jgi:hypothetical protein
MSAALRPGAHRIGTSTAGPDTARELAGRLSGAVILVDAPGGAAERIRERGAERVDSPGRGRVVCRSRRIGC